MDLAAQADDPTLMTPETASLLLSAGKELQIQQVTVVADVFVYGKFVKHDVRHVIYVEYMRLFHSYGY